MKKISSATLRLLMFESKDSIHSFEFPYVDTDNNLDPEHFDNEEYIICNEQEQNGIEIPMLYVQALTIFHLYWLGPNPSPWRCKFLIDFIS
ncbi:hypothetical protein AVEN_160505-1 [Araneus ventricosus]|uniref:Uncharacterized protein n=1 Tax=Araneus ventricosus TaxID=182803 RepID=A0A4Y2NAV7_ARAVE|nr:hypothetical protein AVEN_160505-1 [Araneus ventricosus]